MIIQFQFLLVIFVGCMTNDVSSWTKRINRLRIVNGKNANLRNRYYQVSIRLNGQHYCGGTIISNKFILTAGHCIIPLSPFLTVLAGTTNLGSSEGQIAKVAQTYRHELFNWKSLDYDVGLLELAENLLVNDYQHPITITKNFPKEGIAVISGWGFTSESGNFTQTLQSAVVPLIPSETCKLIYKKNLTPRMFCAGYLTGETDACQGDSGGPLVFGNELIGVISWGIGCARASRPGVYSNITEESMKEFIHRISGL